MPFLLEIDFIANSAPRPFWQAAAMRAYDAWASQQAAAGVGGGGGGDGGGGLGGGGAAGNL